MGDGALNVYCMSNMVFRAANVANGPSGMVSLVDGIPLLSKEVAAHAASNWYFEGLKDAQVSGTSVVFYVVADSVDVFKRAASIARILGVDAYAAGFFHAMDDSIPRHVARTQSRTRLAKLSPREMSSVLASYGESLDSVFVGLELQLVVEGEHPSFHERSPIQIFVEGERAFLVQDDLPRDLRERMTGKSYLEDSADFGYLELCSFRDKLVSLSGEGIEEVLKGLQDKRNTVYILLRAYPPTSKRGADIVNKAQDCGLDVAIVF